MAFCHCYKSDIEESFPGNASVARHKLHNDEKYGIVIHQRLMRHCHHRQDNMKSLHFFIAAVVILNLLGLSSVEASTNSEAREILLRRLTNVHSKWQLIKELEIEGAQMLVAAQNPLYPKLRPVWLIKKGVIYSINGAAKTLTDDFQFSYDITPSEAIDIIEGRKTYKSTDSKGKTWYTHREAIELLKAHGFITGKEATIIRKFDEYIDDPNNSDSTKALDNWATKHNITPKRLTEIDIMRYGYKSIADIGMAGFVRIGEKKTIKEIAQPTGKLIKRFDVSYKKTTSAVLIQVQTDLPDGSPLMFAITKTGLKPDDIWIGNESKTIVRNGKAEVTIPLVTYRGGTLKRGRYDVEILFNSDFRIAI